VEPVIKGNKREADFGGTGLEAVKTSIMRGDYR
jgi:hypothetical protein